MSHNKAPGNLTSAFVSQPGGCLKSRLPIQSHQGDTTVFSSTPAIVESEPIENETASEAVTFDICSDLPDWQRPNLNSQTAELMSHHRYRDNLEDEPLKSLSEKFWNETVITFTTYGLSARLEPMYLSGVWTATDAMTACHLGDRPDAINQGTIAELWLIGHRLVDIAWTEAAGYQVQVDSVTQGFQVIQFNRVESNETLPVTVLATDKTEIPVISGDW